VKETRDRALVRNKTQAWEEKLDDPAATGGNRKKKKNADLSSEKGKEHGVKTDKKKTRGDNHSEVGKDEPYARKPEKKNMTEKKESPNSKRKEFPHRGQPPLDADCATNPCTGNLTTGKGLYPVKGKGTNNNEEELRSNL